MRLQRAHRPTCCRWPRSSMVAVRRASQVRGGHPSRVVRSTSVGGHVGCSRTPRCGCAPNSTREPPRAFTSAASIDRPGATLSVRVALPATSATVSSANHSRCPHAGRRRQHSGQLAVLPQRGGPGTRHRQGNQQLGQPARASISRPGTGRRRWPQAVQGAVVARYLWRRVSREWLLRVSRQTFQPLVSGRPSAVSAAEGVGWRVPSASCR